MNLVPLEELFEIGLGNKFDLNKMKRVAYTEPEAVFFIGRTSGNLGVTATVKRLPQVQPYEEGLITVALGGAILSSFVQTGQFYTAQNVMVLKPRKPMSFAEKIFYCLCIEKNKFKYYTFGREANRSLRKLEVPTVIPEWKELKRKQNAVDFMKPFAAHKLPLGDPTKWRAYTYIDLFKIEKGRRVVRRYMRPGSTPCIRPLDSNNGFAGKISVPPDFPGNLITVNYNGNGVAEAYYQAQPFFATDDVNILIPHFELSPAIAHFICTLIRKEKYRYNYGRKWNLGRMEQSIIRLPSKNGKPDWRFIEDYIKGLPFSSALS